MRPLFASSASALLLALTASLVTAADAHAFSGARIQPFGPLSGPYPVGTAQYQWTDESRPETYSSDPRRKRVVIVQFWYPAEAGSSASSAPYLLSPAEFRDSTGMGRSLLELNPKIETRSRQDAPLSTEQARYPVLIFNPGGGNPRFLNTFLTEQLASQGFVVAAIEHIGDSMATNLPDGTPLELDQLPQPPSATLPESATAQDYEAMFLSSWNQLEAWQFPIAAQDTEFAIGKLEALDGSDSRFKGKLDLERMGALGWSMGGAQSIRLLAHDDRIRAAVDLDGQFFGPDKATLSTSKPFMLLHDTRDIAQFTGARAEAAKWAIELTEQWYSGLFARSTGPRYRAWIEGATHGSFSDWGMFMAYAGTEGDREQAALHERVISELTVAFFRRHLLGEDAAMPSYPASVAKLVQQ